MSGGDTELFSTVLRQIRAIDSPCALAFHPCFMQATTKSFYVDLSKWVDDGVVTSVLRSLDKADTPKFTLHAIAVHGTHCCVYPWLSAHAEENNRGKM
eukprot:1150312-Pelagomonas_calceolata.AAC.1